MVTGRKFEVWFVKNRNEMTIITQHCHFTVLKADISHRQEFVRYSALSVLPRFTNRHHIQGALVCRIGVVVGERQVDVGSSGFSLLFYFGLRQCRTSLKHKT